MKKQVLITLFFVVLAATFVYAVTLTREATERVEISSAIRGQMCMESDCGEVIAGLGTVYGTVPGVIVENFLMFSLKGNIYRSTSGAYNYAENTTRLTSVSGKCSVLDPTAENGERAINCRYYLEVSNGEITNMILNLDAYSESEAYSIAYTGYRLVSIEDTARNIVWRPGDETIE